ncbi:MAG: AAA family ATPase [Actinomycetota bacterium]
MGFDQVLLLAIAIGLVVIGVLLFRSRGDAARPTIRLRRGAETQHLPPAAAEERAPTAEEAVMDLAETVAALKRLADLKDEEIAKDEQRRSLQKTGWRPIAERDDDGGGPFSPPTKDPARRDELPPLVTEVSQIDIDASTKMEADSAAELRVKVGQAFTPAAPVARRDLFAGRTEQLEALVDVAFEKGQHAIIYGERGVGKTSLARILTLIFEEDSSRVAVRVNCDATDDFSSVWKKVVDELDVSLSPTGRGRRAIDDLANKDTLTPNDVRRVLQQVAVEKECIILIDEFDTMTNAEVTRLFADTIKTLSDQAVPTTLVIIGVADSLDELLAEHGSINRALVNIHMPRMSTEELKDIVRRGLQLLTMDIEPGALDLIGQMSQGFPHFAHLLGQAATRSAIDAQRPLVTMDDAQAGIRKVADRVEAWIQETYERATATTHGAKYAEVLLGAALAPNDDKGYFAAAAVRKPLTAVMGKKYDIPSFNRQLNALTEDARGPVLVKTGAERKYRYRFIEPHMEPYVLMRSFTSGLLDASLLVPDETVS